MVLGAGEVSCEVGNTREGGDIKLGAYVCLEDEEGVLVYVPCLEEEVVIWMSRGLMRGSWEGGRFFFDATDPALAARVAWRTAWTMVLMSMLGIGARGEKGLHGVPRRWVPGQQRMSWRRQLVMSGTKISAESDCVSLAAT